MADKDKKDKALSDSSASEEKRGDQGEEASEGLSMMHRDLYAREERADYKARQEALKSLGIDGGPREEVETEEDTLAATKYKNIAAMRAQRTGKLLRFTGLIAAVIFVAVWAVAITVWYRSMLKVTNDDIAVKIEAPQEFTAGEEILYRIVYTNESRVDWQNVEMVLSPPRGFDFRGSNLELTESGKNFIAMIGDLPGGEEGEVHLRGLLIGEQNETSQIRAEVLITPENFPSGRFSQEAVASTTITALPLEVGLGIAQDAASGERVAGTISVRNLSNHSLQNVYLKLDWAKELELAPEDPDFSPGYEERNSEWLIGELASLESRDFTVVFFMSGLLGERRVIDITAGLRQDGEDFVQREVTHVVRVSASELVVEQLYNGSADPVTVKAGERVAGEVQFSNVGTVGLKDVIIEMAFKGEEYDPASIESSGGFYDSNARKIVWTAASIPELAVLQPRDSGKVTYSFAVANTSNLVVKGNPSKNNLLVTVATIDSPDLPAPPGQPKLVVSDRAVISVETELDLMAAAFYDDGRLGIQSTGPQPPIVGQTTTYTLRFRLGSTINDVGNLTMRARLPDGVSYTGQSYMTTGDLNVNPRSGDVTWTVPFVDGLTGRVRPPEELHIQVGITPGDNRRGEAVALLNTAMVEGTDQFTDRVVQDSIEGSPSTATAAGGGEGAGKVR